METLRDVGRQEEELLERRKLSRTLTTPHTTTVKRKGDDTNKAFNTKVEKKVADSYTNTERKNYASPWNAVRSTLGQKTQIDSAKDEHTNWNEAHKGIPDDLVAKRKTGKAMHTLPPVKPWLAEVSEGSGSSNRFH